MILQDYEAYDKFPRHRKWFSKLYVAETLGYDCGPAGIAPSKTGTYIVRPVMNLSGMGVGARVEKIEKDDCEAVEAGYFWCEYFDGPHYSGNYRFVSGQIPYWEPISCWEGTNMPINVTKFTEWKRSKHAPKVPRDFNVLSDVAVINVEFIGDKPIEVHLRKSADPEYDHMIPVWGSSPQDTIPHYEIHGYKYIESYDDGDGQLNDPRLGFMVR